MLRSLRGWGLAITLPFAFHPAPALAAGDNVEPPRELRPAAPAAQGDPSLRSRLRDAVRRLGHGDPMRVKAVLRGDARSRDLHHARIELALLGVPQIEVEPASSGRRVDIILSPVLHGPARHCQFGRRLYRISPNSNDWEPGFGCSSASSIASMIDTPADIYRGRGTLLSDGERAALVIGQYRVVTQNP